jgi:RNA polymerase sigma-70 factor (ECF subfamily)
VPAAGQDHLLRLRSEAEDDTPHDSAELSEQRARLREILTDLPDRQREAIVLRFFEDMSVEETARTMQCAEGTVKATVHQALRSLKNRLEGKGSALRVAK